MTDPLTKPEWRAGVGEVLGSSWTPYSPALTASTTAPTGWVCSGRFYQVGALVTVKLLLVAQTGCTAGVGSYRISLPTPAAAAAVSGGAGFGILWLYDASTGNGWTAQLYPIDVNTTQLVYAAGGASTTVGAAAPWTWAAGDDIDGTFCYEAATT